MNPCRCAALVFALLASATSTVSAEDQLANSAQLWRPHPVLFPVAPNELVPLDAPLPPRATEVRGPVTVSANRTATFWLDTLRVVRVRINNPDKAGDVRFGRVAGSTQPGAARALIDEPGIIVKPGVWYLAQPPSQGAVWFVSATNTVTVHIEHIDDTLGHVSWESTRRAILDWIAADSGDLELPPFPGMSAFRVALIAERDVARAFAAGFPKQPALRRAAADWQRASALQRLNTVRPLLTTYYRVNKLEGDLSDVGEPLPLVPNRPYRSVRTSDRSWQLRLKGPGVLRVEARAILTPERLLPPVLPLAIEVLTGGRSIGSSSTVPYPVRTADDSQPKGVFPRRVELTLPTGEQLGPTQKLQVPLLPGVRVYTLRVQGGPLGIRVTTGQRRSFAGESWRSTAHEGDFVTRARRRLRGQTDPGAALLRAMLDEIAPDPTTKARATGQISTQPLPGMLAALADIVQARISLPGRRVDALVTRVLSNLDDTPYLPEWYLRVKLAAILAEGGRYQQMRRLLSSANSTPPTALMPALAQIMPSPLATEMSRSRMVGLMDLAWRAAPIDDSVRDLYRRLWREQSDWRRLSPSETRERRLQADAHLWLHRDDTAIGLPGTWGLLPSDQIVEINAPKATSDDKRPAIMRLAVSTPNDRPGPVTVHVDGNAFTGMPLRPLERWTFALSPGAHSVRVQAPEGSTVFCSLPASETSPNAFIGAARVERAWPLEIGQRPVRYDLPAPHVQGPIRIKVRALLASGSSFSSTIRVLTDLGSSREVKLDWKHVDRDAAMMDSVGDLSEPITFVVSPPIGARHVWFSSNSALPVIASVAVRRPIFDSLEPTVDPARKATNTDALRGVSNLSRNMDDIRPEAEILIERAHLLLDLGFPDLARRDAARALRSPDKEANLLSKTALRELLARLETIRAPAHLPAGSPAGEAKDKPVPLFPAALILPGTTPSELVETVVLARQGDTEAALNHLQARGAPLSARARYMHARILASDEQLILAGRKLVGLDEIHDKWQIAHEAVRFLGRAVERNDAPFGIASLTYGVARKVDALGPLPLVRKVLLLTSPKSKWESIGSADATGGHERVMVETNLQNRTERRKIRDALVAAPWQDDIPSHSVRAGRTVALQVKLLQPTALYADIWCRQLKLPRYGENPACRVTVLVDGQPIVNQLDGQNYDNRAIELGKAIKFKTPILPTGAHRIEVQLSPDSRLHRVSVRFAADRVMPDGLTGQTAEDDGMFPIRMRRPAVLFVTRPQSDRHVVITVSGPTVLMLTARSSHVERATKLNIQIDGLNGASIQRAMPMSAELDKDAALREGLDKLRELTDAETLLIPIPDSGAHTVRISPDKGLVYVRVSMRVDRPGGESISPFLWQPEIRPEDEFIQWPGAPPALAVLEASRFHPHERLGTFTAATTVRRNDLDEEDDTVALLTRLDVTAAWRRKFIDTGMWVYLGGLARRHANGRHVFGVRAQLQSPLPFFGLRTFTQLRAFGQVLDQCSLEVNALIEQESEDPRCGSNLEWRLALRADIERPFRLHADVSLIPEISLRAAALSLDFNTLRLPGPAVDSDVYSLYSYFHRYLVIPKVALRWQPFQDQTGTISASLVPNQNLGSLDRVQATFRWSTLWHVAARRSVLTKLSYRPSYRYYDDDRFDGYGRHDFTASAETSLWTGRAGRLLLHARATTYLSRLYGRSHTFSVGVEYNITGGRGLRDMFSFEEEYDPYVEGRLFTYDDAR